MSYFNLTQVELYQKKRTGFVYFCLFLTKKIENKNQS